MTHKKIKLKSSYHTIEQLGGKVLRLRRLIDPKNKRWSAFNPSIGHSPELGYAMTIRSSNYIIDLETGSLDLTEGNNVASKVWFCELDNNFNLLNLRQIKFDAPFSLKRGIEDAKLFWRDSSWWFTGIMLEKVHTETARVALFKYDYEANVATFVEKFDGPEHSKPEKNWMAPYNKNPNFDFIYGPTSIVKDSVFMTHPNLNPEISKIRGNTNLLELKDGYLAVVHSLYTKKIVWKNPKTFAEQDGLQKFYTHQFVKFNHKGELTHISREFQFEQNGIEFAAGIVEKNEDFIISYGKDDLSSHLAIISKSTVLDSLKEIEIR
jgi:hypothetical protein